MSVAKPTIALVGNPNVGKTTLFNALTGAHQSVGNWPGVTVEYKRGNYSRHGRRYEVVDLPGIYSLSAVTPDERVARDFLLQHPPDLVINIVDAANLERNLYLSVQLLELQVPLFLVLSMTDIATQNGIGIDYDHLREHLNCSVLPLVLTHRFERDELLAVVDEALQKQSRPVKVRYDQVAEAQLLRLETALAQAAGGEAWPAEWDHLPASWLALKLLERDEAISRQAPESLTREAEKEIHALERHRNQVSAAALADDRYGFIHGLVKDVTKLRTINRETFSDRLDRVVLSSAFGGPIFFVVMYLVFLLAVRFSAPLIRWIGEGLNWLLVERWGDLLSLVKAPSLLVYLLADAVGGGLVTVATFIPPIFFIFLSLSILEDSGYMARAAFIADKFMRRVGLPGKAFIPLIVGFGCTVPAILATRTLESKRDRVFASLLTPFMSCGAKLPVYTFLALLFFPRRADLAIFGLYLGGALMALLFGLALKKTIFRSAPGNFVMELPPYHLPTWNAIGMHTWHRLKDFVLRAGKTILLVSVAISLLQYISLPSHSGSERSSILESGGKLLTPLLEPMGVRRDNWEATVALISGLFAKEAIVGTLRSLYPETGAIPRDFGGSAAGIAFLLFVLLYSPCAASLTILFKEHGRRWMLFTFVYLTLLAWIVATVAYQLLAFNARSWLWLGLCAVLAAAFAVSLHLLGRKHALQA